MYVLTREDARQRSASIKVRHIDVSLDLSGATRESHFPVCSHMTLVTATPDLFIDCAGIVQQVSVNGIAVPYTHDGERIDLHELPTDQEITISVDAQCRYSTTGEGLHRYRDPEDGRYYLYTQFEPEDAHRAWPCFDQPDIKPQWTFHVIAPSFWVVTSNGVATTTDLEESNTRWDFSTTPPLSSYITAVVAGQWAIVDGGTWEGSAGDGASACLDLRLMCRQALAEAMDSDDILAVTRAGLDHYHAHYGYTYPWGSYDQIFVPEYNLGAMENPGCVTFTESYLSRDTPSFALRQKRANTILHEMCHMWFGDLVTPAWWDNLWLKESFAENQGTTTAAEATVYTGEWASFAIGRKAWAYAQDQYPTTHPIVADIPDIPAATNNFDGITYAKGASVLKQLVAWVGEDAFYQGVRLYFQRHANGATSLDDLLTALEEASGYDLASWKDAWLLTTGPSKLSVRTTSDEDGKVTSLTLVQEGLARPHCLNISYWTSRGDALQCISKDRVRIEGRDLSLSVPEEFSVPGGADMLQLIVVNDDDLTYAIGTLDERSTQTALSRVSRIEETITRTVIWSHLFAAVREGELDPRRYIDAALTHMTAEKEDAIFERLLATIAQSRTFLPGHVRGEYDSKILQAIAQAMRATSLDRSRSLLHLFVDVWSAGADTSYSDSLVALARGEEGELLPLIAGEESAWVVRCALAARGLVDEKQLDAWLDESPTGENKTRWVRARSSIPNASIREAVWKEVLSLELSNHHLSASLQGLNASSWEGKEYTDHFFAELSSFWERASMGLGLRYINAGFPMSLDSDRPDEAEHLLALTRQWLTDNESAAAALARLVTEKLDDCERAFTRQKQWQ